jgi:hypothetical protein
MRLTRRGKGLVGVVSLIAGIVVVVGPSSAGATVADGDVVLGHSAPAVCVAGTDANCETTQTGVVNSGSGNALVGLSRNAGSGVVGGTYDSSPGVFGYSDSGGTGNGVQGEANDSGASGVYGQNKAGGNGVYGETTSSGTSGVYGHNAGTGYGVAGRAESGTGTLGDSTNGTGVAASSQNGTGLDASTAFGTAAKIGATGGGTALSVTGKSSFSRSGIATVSGGKSSASGSLVLNAQSMVLATIQGNVAGVYVQGVTIVAGSPGSFTIHLNKATPSALKVAWFVLN